MNVLLAAALPALWLAPSPAVRLPAPVMQIRERVAPVGPADSAGLVAPQGGGLLPTERAALAAPQAIPVQGGSLRTWSYSYGVEQVQVVLTTEGRPLDADIELWHGPNSSPTKMRVYVEDGQIRPFSAVVETPRGSNTIAIRNIGHIEFPIIAAVVAEDVDVPTHECVDFNMLIQGGALRTFPLDPMVDSVQVLLRTDGRPLNARIELLQGPNNNKQVVELYTEDGMDRPFFCVLETPGFGSVVRVVNTAHLEFPMTASVVPLTFKPELTDAECVVGGVMGSDINRARRSQPSVVDLTASADAPVGRVTLDTAKEAEQEVVVDLKAADEAMDEADEADAELAAVEEAEELAAAAAAAVAEKAKVLAKAKAEEEEAVAAAKEAEEKAAAAKAKIAAKAEAEAAAAKAKAAEEKAAEERAVAAEAEAEVERAAAKAKEAVERAANAAAKAEVEKAAAYAKAAAVQAKLEARKMKAAAAVAEKEAAEVAKKAAAQREAARQREAAALRELVAPPPAAAAPHAMVAQVLPAVTRMMEEEAAKVKAEAKSTSVMIDPSAVKAAMAAKAPAVSAATLAREVEAYSTAAKTINFADFIGQVVWAAQLAKEDVKQSWLLKLDIPKWGEAAEACAEMASTMVKIEELTTACALGDAAACEMLAKQEQAKVAWIAKLEDATWSSAAKGVYDITAIATEAVTFARKLDDDATNAWLSKLDFPQWTEAAQACRSVAAASVKIEELTTACASGDDAACAMLCSEEEARAAWLAKLDARTWSAAAKAVSDIEAAAKLVTATKQAKLEKKIASALRTLGGPTGKNVGMETGLRRAVNDLVDDDARVLTRQ